MLTVLFEFFLIGLVCLGWLFPSLDAGFILNNKENWFELLRTGNDRVANGSIYAYGLAFSYVTGIVFHFISRICFEWKERRVRVKVLSEYGDVSGVTLSPVELRKRFRDMRHSVFAISEQSASILVEQDQLVRITRGAIIPLFMTFGAILFWICVVNLMGYPSSNPRVGLSRIAIFFSGLFFMFALLTYFAYVQRIKDYYRNTCASFFQIKNDQRKRLNLRNGWRRQE